MALRRNVFAPLSRYVTRNGKCVGAAFFHPESGDGSQAGAQEEGTAVPAGMSLVSGQA